jgi:hypothetical protein
MKHYLEGKYYVEDQCPDSCSPNIMPLRFIPDEMCEGSVFRNPVDDTALLRVRIIEAI